MRTVIVIQPCGSWTTAMRLTARELGDQDGVACGDLTLTRVAAPSRAGSDSMRVAANCLRSCRRVKAGSPPWGAVTTSRTRLPGRDIADDHAALLEPEADQGLAGRGDRDVAPIRALRQQRYP